MVAQFSQTATNNLFKFDIRNFTDTLTPAKEKNKYICPVCAGHNLSIDMNTGEYQCWNGCECKDIREAIKPWSEVLEERRQGNYNPRAKVTPIRRKTRKPQLPLISSENISIGTLPHPVSLPARERAGEYFTQKHIYSDSQYVLRYELENGKKPETQDGKFKPKPYHLTNEGEWKCGKGDSSWLPYRFDEIEKYGKGKWVLLVEGESCVDVARVNYQLLAVTFQGADWGNKALTQNLDLLKSAGVLGVLKWRDHDDTGYKKAKKCSEVAANIGLPFVILDPLQIWSECPHKGDIADFADTVAMTGDDLAALLQFQIREAALLQEESEEFDDIPPGGESEKLAFNQLAFNALYAGQHWICAADKLYKWSNNYYELVSDGNERKRIRNFCNHYCVKKFDRATNRVVKTYPYAKTHYIEEALKWAKAEFHVDIDKLNPSGLNCLNGILQINWDGSTPSWQLVPHSPDYYYTYPPLIEYNPNADPRDCDRLLAALDAPQQEIFLKIVAASLDLATVRKYKGRLIRALLLKGTGSNGKDALREAISTIYGKKGVTSATITDFVQYDNGRRFPLANLIHSRINWSSENIVSAKLDKIQSLKAFITGNPLVAEAKGKDGREFIPNAISLFNINDVPNMQGSLEAILSRYVVINFNKTYKTHPDLSKGELPADPRFAYDPFFLQLMVCPALLNRLLAALKDLMANGIDYSCTQKALLNIQIENSHLFQFIQDTGLDYDSDSYLGAADIWSRLEQWYVDNGTLTYEEGNGGKKKAIWAEQVRPSDKNVKAVNQVLARFKQLFPQAKLATVLHPSGKKKIPVLQGVSFRSILNKENCIAISDASTPMTTESPPGIILTEQDFHPNHPQFTHLASEEKNQIHLKTPNQSIPSQQFVNENNLKAEGVEDLGVIGVEADTASISATNAGVEWDGNEMLIAMQNDLLTMAEANIAAGGVHDDGMATTPDITQAPQTQSQPQYQVGDKIRCYPSYDHAENKWAVTATITAIEYIRGYLQCCDVQYFSKKGQKTARICGGSAEWILGRA
jgi:putative DNA primase/helicase